MNKLTFPQRFRRWIGRLQAKAATMAFIPQWLRYSFMYPSWGNLVADGYKGNATVFACVSILSRTFPEPELWAWKTADGKEQKIINHPLRQLLAKPNADMGEAELFQFAITYAPIGGNVYLWKQRNNGRKVIALWPFHDGHMQPVPGLTSEEGMVAYYVLDVGDGRTSEPLGD